MDTGGGDFSDLLAALPIGAYRSRADGRMLRANPALVRLNGYEAESELLAAVSDIATEWYVQPERRAEFERLMRSEGRLVGFESEIYRHRTRERIWISECAHAVRDAQGQLLYYEGTVEEITARVLAEQALQRSQEQLQQLVELIPGMVYRVSIEPGGRRRYRYVSEHVRTLYHVEPKDVLADSELLIRMVEPGHAHRLVAMAARATADEAELRYELPVQLADGTRKWVQAISRPAPPEGGLRTRVGVLFDVTERKSVESDLLAQAEVWKRALEASGDGVWDWRVAEGIETLSPQCLALYGIAPNEFAASPHTLDMRTHPDDVPGMNADREAHFSGRAERYVNEHRVQHKDGHWLWILSRGMVIERDEQGRPLRMVGTHTDITARKQADALRHERNRAAAADQAKTQFLSRVSHELRTPLNAVLGFAQLLEMQPPATPVQAGWVGHILSSGRHLLSLLDDVLDLSSAETGQLQVHLEPVALEPLLAEALLMFEAQALAAGVTLTRDLAATPQDQVIADRKRLLQVLSNLLSNAIKYNQRGGWVRLSLQPDGECQRLDVADSGPGLSPEQQALLFQPFERLGAQRGPIAGTGLGLALSRQLAQAMGTDITVRSAPGQGSVFSLALRAA